MAYNKTDKTIVKPFELVEEHYRQKSALFGLIKWWSLERTDIIRKDLCIQAEETPQKIFFNGKELIFK